MIRILLLFSILLSPGLRAQGNKLDSVLQVQPGLVRMEYRQISFPADSTGWSHLYKALHRLQAGEKDSLRIMHFGGSHVQAGFLTEKMRSAFEQFNTSGDPGRGLVFPFHLAHTNNPLDYRISGDRSRWKGYRSAVSSHQAVWGLTGMATELMAETDTLWFKVQHKSKSSRKRQFSKLRIYGSREVSPSEFQVLDEDVPFTVQGFAGRRMTEFQFLKPMDSVRVKVNRVEGDPFQIRGVEFLKDTAGVQYLGVGVNGSRFDSFARCTLMEEELHWFVPDLAIVAIGTNDAYTPNFNPEKYRDQYRNFLQMLRRVNPEVALLLVVPNDAYYRKRYANPNTAKQAEIIRELASEFGAGYWDLYQLMGGLNASAAWHKAGLMQKDRLHFTALGYEVVADLLMEALTIPLFPETFEARLPQSNQMLNP